jgi:GldM C-terminal domain
MKTTTVFRALICLIFALIFKSSFSQTDIINKTLISPDSNVLYLGITNSIEIINNKNPFFEIRSANRSLTSTHNSHIFELRPTRLGWDTVFIIDGNEILFQKAFKIVALPAIEARLGTLRVEEATQEQIYINGWLVLTIPNCKCTTTYVVSSFEVEFESEDHGEEIIKIEGDRLTIKARKVIKSLNSGDVVYFDRIVAKNEDGKSIEVPGFTITVK